uniref:M-phase phosphoprotein 8 n=1 Tax=Tetraodon nigroviridis TaxID=99883 RepID=H3DE10_TETNG
MDSEQDEEDVYEVERIIDMRVEEGEVLYRVRWKNYCSDDDTWEPEAHLEDCHEVLLAFKNSVADAKLKKEPEAKKLTKVLPTKSDVFDADSESDGDRQHPSEAPTRKELNPESIRSTPMRMKMNPSPPKNVPASTAEKTQLDKCKQKKGKWEVKLQGIQDFSDSSLKESSLQKLKGLTSKSKDEAAPHSDSSDSSTLHKKAKSKGQDSASALCKAPSSTASSSSSSSAAAGPTRAKEEELIKEDLVGQKDAPGSTNLFEKFLLHCEAKDRVPRRPPAHPAPAEKSSSKPAKSLNSLLERLRRSQSQPKTPQLRGLSPRKRRRPSSPTFWFFCFILLITAEKYSFCDVVCDLCDCPPAPRSGQSHGFSLDSDEKEGEEPTLKLRPGEERSSWERRTPTEDRRRKREDSEPRLFMACDDGQETQDPLEGADKSGMTGNSTTFTSAVSEMCPRLSVSCPIMCRADKVQATLSLGMDLNLDWMTLDDFQKHLNGEDEILSGPPLSPSELRDAVKSGHYMTVKLALNSKEEYNLDQEDVSGMSLSMLAAAGGHDDILRLLIRKGVRVNNRQKNGTTALMHAAEKNFLTTVAILLEAGSYVNAQTLTGETALMKACKRGNADVVRLLLEYGADCNISSKHKNTAMYFAKLSNNLLLCDLIKDHVNILSSVAEDTIRAYFESRLVLLEAVFPLACHRLCEGPDFSLEFGFKSQPQPEGSGILLFIFHANFLGEITARLSGPCSVHAVVLNDKFQLPIFLDSHFIYSFSPIPGINRLFIRLAEAPTAKVKLLICAYKVQLQ